MKKQYWHKATGVAISECSYMELLRIGAYEAKDFEEAVQHTDSTSFTADVVVPSNGRKLDRRRAAR